MSWRALNSGEPSICRGASDRFVAGGDSQFASAAGDRDVCPWLRRKIKRCADILAVSGR